MKTPMTVVCLAAGLLCGTAFASTEYDFSYTFSAAAPNLASFRDDPSNAYTMFGTFWGTANGDLITGISNVLLSEKENNSLIFNNEASTASVFWVAAGPVFSFSGTNNSFILRRTISAPAQLDFQFSSAGATASNNFYGLGADHFHGYVIYSNGSATNAAQSVDQLNEPTSWSVHAVSAVTPVPEPETFALMSLGLVALCASRRKKTKVSRPESLTPLVA